MRWVKLLFGCQTELQWSANCADLSFNLACCQSFLWFKIWDFCSDFHVHGYKFCMNFPHVCTTCMDAVDVNWLWKNWYTSGWKNSWLDHYVHCSVQMASAVNTSRCSVLLVIIDGRLCSVVFRIQYQCDCPPEQDAHWHSFIYAFWKQDMCLYAVTFLVITQIPSANQKEKKTPCLQTIANILCIVFLALNLFIFLCSTSKFQQAEHYLPAYWHVKVFQWFRRSAVV